MQPVIISLSGTRCSRPGDRLPSYEPILDGRPVTVERLRDAGRPLAAMISGTRSGVAQAIKSFTEQVGRIADTARTDSSPDEPHDTSMDLDVRG